MKIVYYVIGMIVIVFVILIILAVLYGLQYFLQLISGIFPLIFIVGIIYSIYLRKHYWNKIRDKSMMYPIVIGILFLAWILCDTFEQNVKISLASNFVKGFQITYSKEVYEDGSLEKTSLIIPNTTIPGKIVSNIDEWVFGLFIISLVICFSLIKTIPLDKK